MYAVRLSEALDGKVGKVRACALLRWCVEWEGLKKLPPMRADDVIWVEEVDEFIVAVGAAVRPWREAENDLRRLCTTGVTVVPNQNSYTPDVPETDLSEADLSVPDGVRGRWVVAISGGGWAAGIYDL